MVSIDTLVSVGAADRYQSMIDIEDKMAHPSVMRTYQETTQVESEHIGAVDPLPGFVWTAIRPPSLRPIIAVYEASPNDGPGATFSFSIPCGAKAGADAASHERSAVTEQKCAARHE